MNYDPNQQQGQGGYDPNQAWQGQYDPNAPFDPNGQFGFDPQFQAHPETDRQGRPKEGYWRRIGGGSLGLSIAIHAIFLLLAAFFIILQSMTNQKKEDPEDFLPGGGGGGKSNTATMDNKRRMVTMSQPKTKITARVANSTIALPDSPQITTSTSLSAMSLPSGGMGGGEGGIKGRGKGGLFGDGFGSGFGPGMGPGFVAKLPPIMRSRCSPQERMKKLKENGGTEECETAVVKSLDWFATQQNPDGSWGNVWKAGMTGLVLLAYYGHCETPDSPKYGPQIMKGITFLINLGNKNNGFFTENLGKNNHLVYEHGIACYAMGETYSFAKLGNSELPGLRDAFERGVGIILDHQQKEGNAEGNWAYGEGSPHYAYTREDMSVTGWQFQALRAAEHTNLKIAGLKSAMNKAVKYLESRSQPEGGIGHKNAKRDGAYSQWTMTGIGVLGLQTLGNGSTSVINKGLRFIMDEAEKDPLDWKKNGMLYCWYYNTQALFQKGGKDWDTWNGMLRDQILKNQKPDGSYNAESSQEHRHATSLSAGRDADIYRTCLATLMLEVYYRYLKVGGGH